MRIQVLKIFTEYRFTWFTRFFLWGDCHPLFLIVWSQTAYHDDRHGRITIACDAWLLTVKAPDVRRGYGPAAIHIRLFYALCVIRQAFSGGICFQKPGFRIASLPFLSDDSSISRETNIGSEYLAESCWRPIPQDGRPRHWFIQWQNWLPLMAEITVTLQFYGCQIRPQYQDQRVKIADNTQRTNLSAWNMISKTVNISPIRF